MALNDGAAATVAQQIVAALKVPVEGQAKATANWKAVVTAIYAGIQQNAIVEPASLVAPAGTSGGPVTGTGKVQ